MRARTRRTDVPATGRRATRAVPASLAALAIAAVIGFVAPASALAAAPSPTPPTAPADDVADASTVAGYPGDPDAEARLVDEENRRLIDVRAIANAAQWTGATQYRPYRVATGSTYTLVLVARETPYSFDDLLDYLPRSLVRQPDGSYLLTDNIVVDEGATLSIRRSEGLNIKLASDSRGFVSIVTLGGSLQLAGASDKPLTVTAWDADSGAPDTDTTDGRAYVRVTGGRAVFQYAQFSHLGFWSGMTGGVSLTGTDTDFSDGTQIEQTPAGNPSVYGTELLPVGGDDSAAGAEASGDGAAAEPLATDDNLSGYGYVSAAIKGSSFEQNAFGLFITSADGVDISDSTADDNLVDGIVLHRYVSGSTITGTEASRNGGDGFSLRRATTGIVLDRITAADNGRNGVTVNGGTLANGPSATGMPLGTYGNNEVSSATITGNTRYGVEVLSGTGVTVRDSTVTGGDMGIVVSGSAASISVIGNTITSAARQGIALRDGVTASTVSRNAVEGTEQGVYLRDAVAAVSRNDITSVTGHGVTVVGEASGSVVEQNRIAGRGLSAVDTSRTDGVSVVENDTTAWTATKPLDVLLRSFFQPLTIMWLALGAILLLTAVTGVRRRGHGIRDPYANLAPLSSFTKGVIAREEAAPPTRQAVNHS